MRTIKFVKKEVLMTEVHNLNQARIIKDEIFGKEYDIYVPCNLNVFVTNECPNKCYFCLNKFKDVRCYDHKNYYTILEAVANELDSENYEISITGGEPLYDPARLMYTLKLFNEKKFTFRTICTSGYGLLDKYDGKEICEHLIESGVVNNINVSKMHYNDLKNQEIMGKFVLDNKSIEKINLFFKINNASFRLSSTLIPDGVNSLNEILNYVKFYEKYDIESILFREDIRKNISEKVDIKTIMKDIDALKDFKLIDTLESIFYVVKVYLYKNYIVKVYDEKETNNQVINNLKLIDNKLFIGFGDKVIKEV